MVRILMTGGTGFLGKHVAKEFKRCGYTIYDGPAEGAKHYIAKNIVWRPSSKDLDLTNKTDIDAAGFQPDVILHMAALCGGILANKNSPADFLHKNIDMSSNIFHLAQVCGCKRVYTLGSVCAYPKFCPTPFKEDNLWNGYPEETNAPYGISKRLLLMLGQTYREQYGIGGGHLIPVNLYGEHDHFDPINSHVIPALIRKFNHAQNFNEDSVSCWGTGEATREFLYAGDAAHAIVKAVLIGFDSSLPVNLGTGQDISIKELASLISRLMEFKGEIGFSGEVSDGQPKRMLDVSRAKQLLGWRAHTPLEEGLRRTIHWYRNS
jgi:GDP-L-fucose synthase